MEHEAIEISAESDKGSERQKESERGVPVIIVLNVRADGEQKIIDSTLTNPLP